MQVPALTDVNQSLVIIFHQNGGFRTVSHTVSDMYNVRCVS